MRGASIVDPEGEGAILPNGPKADNRSVKISENATDRVHFSEWPVMVLLVVGFMVGPLKLLGHSWVGYLAPDSLALLILIIVFGLRIGSRKPLVSASPLALPILLIAFVCTLELLNPEAPFLRSVLGIRSWLLYLCFYFVGYYMFRSIKQLERLYALLLVLGGVSAAYGLYQWRAGPQEFASWSEYYGQYARLAWRAQSGAVFRAFSTFSSAGAFGANMGFIMFLAFSVAASPRVATRWRTVAGVLFALMGAGIAASGSRSPVALLLLGGVLGVVLIRGVRRKVRTGLTAILIGGAAVAAVLFLIGPVVGERFLTIFDPGAFFWKWFYPLSIGIRIAAQHLFGMGLGYTAGVPQFLTSPVFQQLPALNIDSGYGSAAAELGFVGLAFFVYFAVKVGVEGFRSWSKLPPSLLRDLLLGPALLAATFPIVSVISQPQATLPGAIYFWLLIGMVIKAPVLQIPYSEDPPQSMRVQVAH